MELRQAALVCPGPVTSPGRLPSPPLPPWGPAHHLLPTPSRHFGNDVKQATQHTVSNSGLLLSKGEPPGSLALWDGEQVVRGLEESEPSNLSYDYSLSLSILTLFLPPSVNRS